ncbi:rh32 [macacine betaherpesvirus 3]|uniref:Rh32 n=1 Tax=Rhesus cytomegalovirus (strain 68-1) TaxID=47929 RepID=Q2FAT9_RHCM6|nr:rh32 [macacine betaherpesvirus 3]
MFSMMFPTIVSFAVTPFVAKAQSCEIQGICGACKSDSIASFVWKTRSGTRIVWTSVSDNCYSRFLGFFCHRCWSCRYTNSVIWNRLRTRSRASKMSWKSGWSTLIRIPASSLHPGVVQAHQNLHLFMLPANITLHGVFIVASWGSWRPNI